MTTVATTLSFGHDEELGSNKIVKTPLIHPRIYIMMLSVVNFRKIQYSIASGHVICTVEYVFFYLSSWCRSWLSEFHLFILPRAGWGNCRTQFRERRVQEFGFKLTYKETADLDAKTFFMLYYFVTTMTSVFGGTLSMVACPPRTCQWWNLAPHMYLLQSMIDCSASLVKPENDVRRAYEVKTCLGQDKINTQH